MKSLLTALLLALLAGCATGPRIDHTYNAKSQSPRVKFIVLHYTVTDKAGSIRALTQQAVSAHYLVTDDPQTVIYGLVPETEMAWHAGVSSWKGYTNLNTSSIGIEIVNPGWTATPDGGRQYYAFPQYQIDALIPLVKDIATRYHVPPENVIGHSDIAPGRKQDPGPLFPWKQLAAAGIALWPDENRVAAVRPVFDTQLPDITWFQRKLAGFGYGNKETCLFDQQTKDVLSAFQSRFRQSNIDGNPDAETAALLEVLTTPAAAPLPVVQPSVPTPNAMCACPVTPPAPAVPVAPIAPEAPAAPVAPPATPVAPLPPVKQ